MKPVYAGLCAGAMLALILACAGCAEIAEGADGETFFGMGQTPTPAPTSTPEYMTVETPYATTTPGVTPTYARPPATTPAPTTYAEIYNASHRFNYDTVARSFNLRLAPMIIEYSVSPEMVERTKKGTSQYGEKEEFSVITRVPDEKAVFSLKVYEKNTGALVIDEGYGGIYGYSEKQKLTVRTPGNYHIEMTGFKVDVTTVIKVHQGNI